MKSKYVFLLSVIFFVSCAPKETKNWKTSLNSNDPAELQKAVVENYAESVYLGYQKSRKDAEALSQAVRSFIAKPSENSLGAARQAWIVARRSYSQTEAFRFYAGPIDQEDRGPEALLNAWPLDEAYIDYVDGDAQAGIINNPNLYPTIDAELLISLNEKNGEKNISTGYHAVEFLLWGQDKNPQGAGNRSFSDYIPSAQNKNAERRADYLRAATDLIVEHLKDLETSWAPRKNNYRSEFTSSGSQKSLEKIMTGIVMMVADEMSGERIGVAYETQAQEEEQSCFSDNTHEDFFWNLKGVENVYLGGSGPGISHLVAMQNPSLDLKIKESFQQTYRAIDRIGTRFDQEILNPEGRVRVEALMKNLDQLGNLLNQAAKILKVRVNPN